ncbi:zinc finger C-x8-C-x5-C-x3-H type family protein [Actinidia rufa]|uniref:Zinc finger C-x8-C-x5-C-x3-H type family protein n=1 Tax=Actinidia rufa TaxID=165716 RepID=A0A7J0H8U7_9ERIC|nr:zinc finger C-x8-C-x5-C-x3-H type family protein [Actinidia rufa]
MEVYGHSAERYGSDREVERGPAGAGKGLEESMRRLDLWNREFLYPERSGVTDCAYYLRSGFCGYGIQCRFNHPRDRCSVGGAVRNGGGEFPESGLGNRHARTGTCKFGASCKFHHPINGALLMVLCVHLTKAPVSPVLSPSAQPTVGVGSLYGVSQLSSSAPGLVGQYPSFKSSGVPSINGQKEINFPKRPGQPDCQYYLKTGACKFGTSCRFNHPLAWVIPNTKCVLSPLGLPLRPVCLPTLFLLSCRDLVPELMVYILFSNHV